MSESNRPPRRNESWVARVLRRLTGADTGPTARPTTARLGVHLLEARDNPAGYWWMPGTGSDLLATTAGNWWAGPGGVPYAIHTVAPGWQDDLYYQGDVTQANCTIPQPATPTNPYGVAFNSINLLHGEPLTPEPGPIGSPPPTPEPGDGYWGTVTAAGSFAVRNLVVECGYLKQADPTALALSTGAHAGRLTVTTALDWTGGTLNSNTVHGYIDLAAGSISTAEPSFTNPGINGHVYLGSTLTLLSNSSAPLALGSTLTMRDGQYDLTNLALIRATAHCNLKLNPVKWLGDTKIVVNGIERRQDDKGLIEIEAGATATVRPNIRPPLVTKWAEVALTGPTPKFLNKGRTVIEDHTNLQIMPDGEEDMGFYTQTSDVGQVDAPMTRLSNGSRVEFTRKASPAFGHMYIQRGELALSFEEDSQGEPHTIQRAAEIIVPEESNAVALNIGTEAKLTTTRSTMFSTLKIEGGFQCKGEIQLFIDRSALRGDKITATKPISFKQNQGTTLRVEWADPSAGPPIAQVNQDQTNVYTLLHSDEPITGISDDPAGFYPTDGQVTITGGRMNGRKDWAAWRQ